MQDLISVCLILGIALSAGLYGWVLISSIRRHGYRATIGGAARTVVRELPLSWRIPWAASTFAVGIPLVMAWTTINGDGDAAGDIALAVLWLLNVALLRWHLRAKRRASGGESL